ncbi:hypothetical protein BRM3_03575 [Brachybacterium huguangmaarense]|uniref:Secreted protein n=1 Tax=Brachybacterium huguangmaarense TaxID=1652028 RepID=A0ABY6G4G4_9MICO|nr:hypothetical protein [Brachybacterium huguangmaarense]UYG17521.1 hypothetical protein BRM3_03575 [Brachybacterium huguangmaarense]
MTMHTEEKFEHTPRTAAASPSRGRLVGRVVATSVAAAALALGAAVPASAAVANAPQAVGAVASVSSALLGGSSESTSASSLPTGAANFLGGKPWQCFLFPAMKSCR